jgi:hypothetical protein
MIRMRVHHLIVASLCSSFLAACAGERGGNGAVTTDSAGVAIITSPAGDRPLGWTLTEELRIGGADEGPASFTAAAPSTVRTNGRDRIVVFDRDRSKVEVFDAAGRPVASMGGRGGGPGEVGMAFALVDAGPDTIAVFDVSKEGVVRWGPDGTILPERRLPSAVRSVSGLALRGDSAFMALMDIDSVRTRYRVVVATATDTTVLDSVLSGAPRQARFHCFSALLPPMFAPRPVWALSDTLLALTRQSSYDVQLYRGGRLVSILRRPLAPVPTSPDAANRMYPDGWKVSFGGGGDCTIPGSEVAEKTGMTSHLPVITELAFGPRGTLWVQRHSFPGDSAVTDVFGRDGGYLGTVTGFGLPLGWLGADRILFPIEDTETGVTVIGVYRIPEAPEAAR